MRRTTALPTFTVAAVAVLALLAACTDDPGTAIGEPAPTTVASRPATSDPGTPASVGAADTGTADAGAAGAEAGDTAAAGSRAAGSGVAGTESAAGGGSRPAGTGIPDAAMLRATDWPTGRIRTDRTGVAALPQTEPSACQPHTAYPSDRNRDAGRTRGIGSDVPESGGVTEVVVRYQPGRATQALAEMRRVLAACHAYRPAPDVTPVATRSYRLERERFAGDDALLVLLSDRMDSGRVAGDYITVVRLGDAVITTTSEVGEATADREVALRLAAVGAQRAACLRSTC